MDNKTHGLDIDELINNSITNCTTLKELNDFLDTMHPSDRYLIIKDRLKDKFTMINGAKYSKNKADKEEYERYQEIKQGAKASYDHDNKYAKMIDVDKACTKVYGLLLTMIREQNNRIGNIEDILEVKTKEDGADNDNNKQKDVKGQ